MPEDLDLSRVNRDVTHYEDLYNITNSRANSRAKMPREPICKLAANYVAKYAVKISAKDVEKTGKEQKSEIAKCAVKYVAKYQKRHGKNQEDTEAPEPSDNKPVNTYVTNKDVAPIMESHGNKKAKNTQRV